MRYYLKHVWTIARVCMGYSLAFQIPFWASLVINKNTGQKFFKKFLNDRTSGDIDLLIYLQGK